MGIFIALAPFLHLFTFMHLADAFIQSDLQCIIHGYTFFYQYVCSLGIEPTTFVLLMQCSTTEPQEHHLKPLSNLWSSVIFCCTSEIYSLFFLIVMGD